MEMNNKLASRGGFHKRTKSVDMYSQARRDSTGGDSNYSFGSSGSNLTTPPDSPKTFNNGFSPCKSDYIDLDEISKHSVDYERKLSGGSSNNGGIGLGLSGLVIRKPSVHRIIEFPEGDIIEDEQFSGNMKNYNNDNNYNNNNSILKKEDKSLSKRLRHIFIQR